MTVYIDLKYLRSLCEYGRFGRFAICYVLRWIRETRGDLHSLDSDTTCSNLLCIDRGVEMVCVFVLAVHYTCSGLYRNSYHRIGWFLWCTRNSIPI